MKSGSSFPLVRIRRLKNILETLSEKRVEKNHPSRYAPRKNKSQNIHPRQFQFIIIAVSPEIGRNFACCCSIGFTVNAFDRADSFLRRGSNLWRESNTRYDSNGPIENPSPPCPSIHRFEAEIGCWPADHFEHAIFFLACSYPRKKKVKKSEGRNETRAVRDRFSNGPTTSKKKKKNTRYRSRENLQRVN